MTIRAKKSLGQNFIRDVSLAQAIVRELDVQPGDVVLEIGPGEGILTGVLWKMHGVTPFTYLAVEKDRRLIDTLQRSFARDGFTVAAGDIRSFDFKAFSSQHGKRVKVIGNIPYYITSDIVISIIKGHAWIERAVLTVQREYAERLTATPCCKEYGRPTVMAGAVADVRCARQIDRAAFHPAPNVDSTVIVITPNQDRCEHPVIKHSFDAFEEFVRCAFASRRKKLSNTAKAFCQPRGVMPEQFVAFLAERELDPNVRPEDLDVQDYVWLCERILGAS